jgi:hypothetical protein
MIGTKGLIKKDLVLYAESVEESASSLSQSSGVWCPHFLRPVCCVQKEKNEGSDVLVKARRVCHGTYP